MYYSHSNRGFYLPAIHGDNMPDDAVEISGETHQRMLEILNSGGEVIPKDGGGFDMRSPADQGPPAPHQVTRAQGKAALIMADLWSAVISYVDGIQDDKEKALALVALNDTTHWNKSSPFLLDAATHLGLTDEQMDDLFRQAAEIEL